MNRKKLMSIASAAVFTIMSASFAAMSAFAEEAADTASSTQQTTSQGSFFTLILPLIIMFALLYFIAIRPQKKRDKELKEMQDSLQVGDEVVGAPATMKAASIWPFFRASALSPKD